MSPRTRQTEFRTTRRRLSKINSIKRKPGESPMDAAFREYKKSHPRAKFEEFETLIAALAGTNRSHGDIGRTVGIRRGNIRDVENAFELRSEAEKERINFESMGRRRKLEHQPGGGEKVLRILDLMKPESGFTEKEICKMEGIDVSTLQRLKRDYPNVRPDDAHHRLRAKGISNAKAKLPEERLLELLKQRVIRKGKIEHAHSIGRIKEIIGGEGIDFTLSGISHFAKKREKETGRNRTINTRLGKLHQVGRLDENTHPYEPREREKARMVIPKPKPIKGRTGPWFFDKENFDETNHRTLEHYFRLKNPRLGITTVATRGMSEMDARRVLQELEEYYQGDKVV
jgi:hypothetical protein